VAEALGLNAQLSEALALSHDIGHPPFGHAGEKALDYALRRHGLSFDHNLHALRIVTWFEERYPAFRGLNLTLAVREGIVKHSRDLTQGESALLDRYLPELRPPLEAQLIDLADEIAYNSADLDDAYEAGLLGPEQIAAEVAAYAEILDVMETSFPGATERERFQESVRHLIDGLVSGLIQGTVTAAQASGVTDVESVRHFPTRIVGFTPEAAATTRELKQFLHRHVYSSAALAEDRRQSIERLGRLFAHLMAHPELLPHTDSETEDPVKPLHRAVCDYLAGMTDGYFQRVYAALLA